MTNQDYRILTAPVLKPGIPDCDYHQGETPLTTEQINHLMTTYNNEYNIIDYDHKYITDGQWYKRNLGTPLRSWQSNKDTTYIDIFDVEQTAPAGSWWLQSKITDPEAIKKIDQRAVNSYSLTTANKAFADRFLELTSVSAKSVTYTSEVEKLLQEYDMISTKHRTLIRDIKNPVGFTVSLTGLPCVGGACFAKKCLDVNQEKTHNTSYKNQGSDKMTETTNETNKSSMSLDDIKSLFSWFTSIKAEERKEEPTEQKEGEKSENPDKEYVTQDELNNALEENNKKLLNEVSTLLDEKLKEKDDEGKEPDKEEEKKGETEEGKVSTKSQTPPIEPDKEELSTKSQGQSQQIDDPDPQDQISTKHENDVTKILNNLGRDALGNTKIRL